jgi:phosphomannomutase/phosphoglucomutase
MKDYIFRKYDIRGIVEEDFPESVVQNLGKAFGTFVRRRGGTTVALSGDIRLTTPTLKEWFAAGMLSAGIDVIDIGIVPTPTNYFSMYHLKVDGAVQITGSHNPPEYNGFKLSHQQRAVYGDQIQELRKLIEENDFESGAGNRKQEDVLAPYTALLIEKIKLERPLRIVMDCGNAAAALVAPEVFKRMDIELEELYCTVDGTFPNHHPDPTEDLIAVIGKGGYDFGVAYDGDADRIGVVDDQGNMIFADTLMAVFLEEVARPGEPVVFDVKCSQALEEEITRRGAKPIMWKTGHSLIKDKMREMKVGFAGEMSGHLFFADEYFGYDDAIYASLRLARLVSRQNRPLSALVAEIPKYQSTPEMRLECPTDEEKFKIAAAAEAYFKANYECIDIDGVRIKFGDGWGLVRASNTQPVIVCRFEARTSERLEEIKSLVLTQLQEFGDIQLAE